MSTVSTVFLSPNIVNDTGNTSDSGSLSGAESSVAVPPRFPHTRAQLSAIAKEYKTSDAINVDSDTDGEAVARVSNTLVKQVATLLDNEQEDARVTELRRHGATSRLACDEPRRISVSDRRSLQTLEKRERTHQIRTATSVVTTTLVASERPNTDPFHRARV